LFLVTLISFEIFQELGSQLWTCVWDSPGCLPIILPWHGKGFEDVPFEVSATIELTFSIVVIPLTTGSVGLLLVHIVIVISCSDLW